MIADQNDALGTLQRYVQNPLNGPVTVEDLDRVRTELLVNESSVPEQLREPLNRQVGVLNSAIQGVQDGNVTNVDVDAFRAAGQQVLDTCQGEVR